MMARQYTVGYKSVELFKDQILGMRSYGKVCKTKCDDLLCAAKLLHETLFDPTTHSLLLQRLCEIHTDPFIVQWIRSYLTCRSQVVVVGGEQSSAVPVISGVPQGSVLGPLLFLIFINEVVHQVSQDSCMSLFADDMALYRPIHSTADYYELQRDISAIVNWINASLLALQPSKCCYMIITRKRSLKLPPPPLSWLRVLH